MIQCRLESLGVIEKTNHSEWAAPIVPVPKADGSIGICGDYKVTINPGLQVTGGSRGTSLSSVELPRIIPTKYRRLRIDT